MKLIALTDEQAEIFKDMMQEAVIHVEMTADEQEVADAITAQLDRSTWTMENYSAMPMAPFNLIDEVMAEARVFITAQNRYNDVKNITAAAVAEHVLAVAGFKSRGA